MAQQKTRNLSVELLGAQNIVGINYDSRFDGNSGLGYRYQRPNGFMLAYRRPSISETSMDSKRLPSFHISA